MQGSLIHLTAYNRGVIGAAICIVTFVPCFLLGVLLHKSPSLAALVGAFVVVPVFGVLYTLLYCWAPRRSGTEFHQLVACLERMFKAQRAR